jgi:hypothetical protein
MKPLMNILLVAGLITGVFNCAEAQRNRNNGGSSRGEGRERNVSPQRGGERFSGPNVSEARSNGGNRYNFRANGQRDERRVFVNRENSVRNIQPRNEVARIRERDNRVDVARVNRDPAERFDRGRGNSRYNNSNSRYSNNYAYNDRYNNYGYNNRYNSNRYYRTGYNRRFSFAYGPRYSIIPRNHISIYFGGNPYYFYDGFYYGYYGGYYNPIFPPIGLRIGFLPFGYSSLFIGGYPYYYYNGIYYRQYDDNEYEVVDPPMGATVYSLPKGAKSVILNGEKMYELNGTYYKEDRNSKGQVIYTVVGKNGEINNSDTSDNNPPVNNDVTTPPASLQMGDIVNQLPEGSKVVTINGEKMYVAPDDTYLKEESDGGVVQYKVVGIGK